MVCRLALVLLLAAAGIRQVWGQSFGVETHNVLMPASGGMAGTSVAQPQDLASAINGNPATLTQFPGTQFTFSGAWVEPTFNLIQSGPIPPIIEPFAAKAENQGIAGANIGATYDLCPMGMPAVFGVGFFTTAAGGVDFRQVPESNASNSALNVFQGTTGLGWFVTDRLSIGATMSLGIGFFDGPYVGIGGLSYDYAIRSAAGWDYLLTPRTRVGMYYQTVEHFTFDNAIELDLGGGLFDRARDIQMSLPDNVGLGVSNSSLAGGRLLLAADVLYKNWDNADLFRAVYHTQWVLQTGAQFTQGRIRYRLGYAYAENPLDAVPDITVGGVTLPFLTDQARYLQAQLAIANLHRMSAGIGIQEVLPNLDIDLFAGGMFEDSQVEGPLTSTNLESYWVGFGLTWRFGPPC
jgi:long-chain fatty acid transport protein